MKFLILVFISTISFAKDFNIAIDNVLMKNIKVTDKVIEKIKKSYQSIGIEPVFVNIPSLRSLRELKEQKIDADYARFYKVIELNKLNYIPTHLTSDRLCLFNRDGKYKVKLKDAHVVTGFNIFTDLKAKKLSRSKTIESALQIFMTRKGVDYLASSQIVVNIISKVLKVEPPKCAKIYGTEKVYHVISKKHKSLIPKLNKEFKKYFPVKLNEDIK